VTGSLYSRRRIRMQKIAETYDIGYRQLGARQGSLGLSARHVFEVILSMVDRDGQLEAKAVEIVSRTGLSRTTVQRSLVRLREHGFLDYYPSIWTSRGTGPIPIYVSNTYCIRCPPALRSQRHAKRHTRFYDRSQAFAHAVAALTATPTITQELGS